MGRYRQVLNLKISGDGYLSSNKQQAAMSTIDSNKIILYSVAPWWVQRVNSTELLSVDGPSDMRLFSYCQSQLGRELDNRVTRTLAKMLAHTTTIGVHILVYGARAGSRTMAQYLPGCKITPTVGFMMGKRDPIDRVWRELSNKLEVTQPSMTSLEK